MAWQFCVNESQNTIIIFYVSANMLLHIKKLFLKFVNIVNQSNNHSICHNKLIKVQKLNNEMNIEKIESGMADININPFPIIYCMINFDLRQNRVTTVIHTIELLVKLNTYVKQLVGVARIDA